MLNYSEGKAVAANENIKERDYWLNKFSGDWVKAFFNYDFQKNAPQRYEMETLDFRFPGDMVAKLITFSKNSDYALHIILTAGVAAILKKYTGLKDIIVGAPIYKQKIEGEFINTVLALRVLFEEGMTFKGLLLKMRETVVGAAENQNYPIETLLYKLGMELSADDFPLFDVVVLLENIHDKKYINHIHPNIIFSFLRRDEYIGGRVEFNSLLYKKMTVEKIINHFKNLSRAALFDLDLKISAVNILSEEEKRQVLFEFNNTKKNIVRDKCYHQLFEKPVIQNPGKIAAAHNNSQITYKKLNEDAGRIANYLLVKGVKPGAIVGIYMKRNIDMLTSIIGIFKAGAAYLPLEVDYPTGRIQYIIDNSEMNILITAEQDMETVKGMEGSLPHLENILYLSPGSRDILHEYPVDDPGSDSSPDHLAYIIYTSGTTGKPKGVMIHQLGMINHLYAKINDLSITGTDTIAQTASCSFDISVWQFLAALLTGGKTFIIDRETVLEPGQLLSVLQTGGITILESVPSLMGAFFEMLEYEDDKELKYLRRMLLTGEALKPYLVRKWFEHYPGIPLVNAYGPTEASDDITHYIMTAPPAGTQSSIPVGKPIQNTGIYILDKDLMPCPVGVPGEICTAGLGVGKGYWKDAEKTGNSFIPNPYSGAIGDNDYATLYRTGDIGYFMEDGNVRCLGRIDQQVKIRGNRVELEEIERTLLNYTGVKEAVVILKDASPGTGVDYTGENKSLCAFVTADVELAPSALKEYLGEYFPAYMIPEHITRLAQLPLTPNGKIDYSALAQIEIQLIGEKYAAPENQLQVKIVEIWSEVLGVEKEKIGINTNFFEAGGHSLRVTSLVSRIHKELNVKIPFIEVFRAPTVTGIARYIKKEGVKEKFRAFKPIEKKEYYALSSPQKRFYLLHQLNRGDTTYNMSRILEMEATLEEERLETIFKTLIRRHESLRTSFKLIRNEPHQVIHPGVEFKIDYARASGENAVRIMEDYIKPFDLSTPPLLRVGLIDTGNRKILLVDMHHIITDGVSLQVLTKEFISLYERRQLSPLPIQYKDYASWQNNLPAGTGYKKMEKYWLDFLHNFKITRLPEDHITRDDPGKGDLETAVIEKSTYLSIEDFCLKYNLTKFSFLLSVFVFILTKEVDENDITIGTPIANRDHADLENIIGIFLNVVLLRAVIDRDDTIINNILRINKNAVAALENSAYPYEELYYRVKKHYDLTNDELFTILFNYFPIDEIEVPRGQRGKMSVEPFEVNPKYDVTLYAADKKDEIYLSIVYRSNLYSKERIRRMITNYFNLIEAVISNEDMLISDLIYRDAGAGAGDTPREFAEDFDTEDLFL